MIKFDSYSRFYVLFLLALVLSPAASPSQEIIRHLEAPGPDARGLAWDGQYLWCAEVFSQKVYQLDPNDGSVVSSFDFNIEYQYGGLAWSDDDYLWITDYRGTSWFIKVNPTTGEMASSFHCPGA